MNKFRKIVVLMTAASAFCSPFGVLSASEATQGLYHNGYAYEGSRRASTVTPIVVVGTVASVAVVAVLCTNDSHNHYKGHYHGHKHSHSHSH